MPSEEVGQLLLDKLLFVHLDNNNYAKFELLMYNVLPLRPFAYSLHLLIYLPSLMMQKLLAFVHGKIASDNMDVPSAQEILLPGHTFLNIFQVWWDRYREDARNRDNLLEFWKLILVNSKNWKIYSTRQHATSSKELRTLINRNHFL